jgi:hypothetical protein
MPLGDGFYGIDNNKTGAINREYGKFCFQGGAFTMPDLTV